MSVKDNVVIIALEGAGDEENYQIAEAVRKTARDNRRWAGGIYIITFEPVGRHLDDQPLDVKVPVFRHQLPQDANPDDRWIIDEALVFIRRLGVDERAPNTVVLLMGPRWRVLWRHWLMRVKLWSYPGVRFLRTHDNNLVGA